MKIDKEQIEKLKPTLGNKEWRMSHLYKIVDKNKKRIIFKKNKVQEHFDKNKHIKNIILKSRQLGMTTYECVDMLDDTLFTRNFSGLFIAHTDKDATEIFDKKVDFAWNNIELKQLWKVDSDTSKKLKFNFGDGTFSSIMVSNSGRSGTYNRIHVSELAKLCAKYPAKADEIVTGTFPSAPIGSRIDIESTAEGMTGNFYKMFTEAWNRKREPLDVEFKAHFYNWTWDDEEISKIKEIIPVDEMDESQRFKEYQELNNLSDTEITYYYKKWLEENKDWDKLHQEYPTTQEEAFVASGNTFFNKERIISLMAVCPEPIEVERDKIPEKLYNYYLNKELEIYELPEAFNSYVAGGDVAEGKGGDRSVLEVLNNKTLKTAIKFKSDKVRPDLYAEACNEIGKWYNYAYMGIESNSGLWVLTELMETYQYPNLYFREAIDDITHSINKKLGFSTTGVSRKPLLDNLLVAVNMNDDCWNNKDFLKECLTFIRNDNGRPEASEGNHDDEVISMAIAHYIRENAPAELKRPVAEPITVAEKIRAYLNGK